MELDPSGVFIPEEVFDEIIKGSHEVMLGMIAEAVQESAEDKFGSKVAGVLATFPGYVIVATDSADFYRVKYNVVKEGVELKSVEQIQLPVVTRDTVGDYVSQEARKVVEDLFRVGTTDDVCSRLHNLSEAVMDSGRKFTPAALEESIKSRLFTDPTWWTGLQQNEELLQKLHESVEHSGIEPRFRAIVDGTIDEEKLDQYRELVSESLRSVAKRVGELGDAAKLDLSDLVLKPEFVNEDSDAAVEEFGEFVQSYCESACGLAEELRDAVELFDDNCLVCSADIHDQVATMLPNYEAGAEFIRVFSERFEGESESDDVDGDE